ncbi:hypothetical protein [Yersinia similis]|uniref:hypothetical protein n=1 Tax=Yersinia similis TaxID=367190 RepID=UPI00061CDACE|nr:hypothetical protein [Yersinia similis]CNC62261.1 Uncharacterised protein [Yersinia similis]
MSVINNFTIIDTLGSYDRKLNPQGLSVLELLPIGISWSYAGKKKEIYDNDKIIPLLLRDSSGIALIKSPFNKVNNKAYILNPDKTIKWDVKRNLNINDAIFFDVYYISNDLYFFIYINGGGFRFLFDIESGSIGELIRSY